ncbi:MAG: hypothetical protein KGL53_04065, partial [Elusimicrobia bacterium]|nr:hypothetical protein [Elusimicrobiota bacterium]
MAALLAFAVLLTASPSSWAKTSVISVDPGDPAYEATRAESAKAGKGKAAPARADVEVGPAMHGQKAEAAMDEPPRKAPRHVPTGSRVPAIFAVFVEHGRWALLPRRGNARPARGERVEVIGSRGVGEFQVQRPVVAHDAACSGSRHLGVRAWALTAKDKREFKRVGVPVIGILLKRGQRFDSRRARFSRLKNGVNEAVYRRLDAALRKAAAADLVSGVFKPDAGDSTGLQSAGSADPSQVQLKIDFAARVRVPGLQDPMVLVDGAEFSRSFRRCMRLVDGE